MRKLYIRLFFMAIFCLALVGLSTVFPLAEETVREEVEQVHENQTMAIPDHEIRYEETLSPDWKSTWYQARQLYREQKFREALVQYEILLGQKSNIEEARWEYTSILMHLERWQQAGEQLEKLLARDPDNTGYLSAMARVRVETGQWERAVKLYGRVYEQDPDGREGLQALEGLLQALEQLGHRESLLPLVEELIGRRPDDLDLQKKQAMLLIELGRYEKAAAVLNTLEQNAAEDGSVYELQAILHSRVGDEDGAAGYWQKLIAIDKENQDAHRHLQQYYAEQENWTMSLKHLEMLLRKTPDDIVLLEQAAELNVKIGRLDSALQYYDYCLALQPGNMLLLQKKKVAQKILARDLLTLVENEGSQKLWQDLKQVTTDRPGIYREIAVLLRQKGRTNELIDVLTLLYHENPQDEKTYLELAALLKQNGRRDELNDLRNNTYTTAPVGN